MKCSQCGSEKLRAVGDSLDYVFYRVQGKWVISNPQLTYFNSSHRPYQIYCYDCHNQDSVKEITPQSSATIDHKEIVLDLDHTLFFVDYGREVEDYDFKFTDPSGSGYTYYVYRRPHLDHFIKELCKRFEKINFFTAATSWYAAELINSLSIPSDKKGFVKSREHTVRGRPLSFEWELIKNMENSLMVEDRPLVVEGYNNTVFKVTPFYLNKEDKDLLMVLETLSQKGKVSKDPETVSGTVEVFLRHLPMEVVNMPFSLVEEILKIPVRSQEEINKGFVRTSVFPSYFEVKESAFFLRLVDLDHSQYLKLYALLKPFTKAKKMSSVDYKALLNRKSSWDNDF